MGPAQPSTPAQQNIYLAAVLLVIGFLSLVGVLTGIFMFFGCCEASAGKDDEYYNDGGERGNVNNRRAESLYGGRYGAYYDDNADPWLDNNSVDSRRMQARMARQPVGGATSAPGRLKRVRTVPADTAIHTTMSTPVGATAAVPSPSAPPLWFHWRRSSQPAMQETTTSQTTRTAYV